MHIFYFIKFFTSLLLHSISWKIDYYLCVENFIAENSRMDGLLMATTASRKNTILMKKKSVPNNYRAANLKLACT